MSMLQPSYRYRCWNCGRLAWICDADHFFTPMIKGAIQGALIGGVIGATIALVENFLRSL